MKYVKADLVDDVVSSYDQTKTTIQGRCFVKTIDGDQAIGPSINKFVDIVADSGITIAPNAIHMTESGRMFVLSTESGIVSIVLHEIDYDTGVVTYIGRLQIRMPDTAATTTTQRGLKVLDSGTTGWKIFIATTGSVTINGGLLLVNNVDRSDFLQTAFITLEFATGDNQKAVYKLEDPANIGAGNLNTATAGIILDKINEILYVHNGVAATHQYYLFDAALAPTYATSSVAALAADDIIQHAGHTFNNGDPVTFPTLTGGAPLVVGNTYFVRDVVAGVSYRVSSTTGGTAINITSDLTSGTIGRGHGTTGSNFIHKTGNLPALTGTLLLTDSEDYALPAHTSNAGQPCAFFATTTNMYLGQLSELTSGATTWPSLVPANLLGTLNQIVTPTATQASWSNILDAGLIVAGSTFILKKVINNEIISIFGGTSNKYLEGFNPLVVGLQSAAPISGVDVENGWLAMLNTTVAGQRGVILSDLYSDAIFDHSFFVTKVMDTPDSVYKFLASVDKLFDFTGSLQIFYRTSGFGSISGGWVEIPFAQDLSAFASGQHVQFKVLYATLGLDTCIPAQVCDFFLGYESQTATSDKWELSVDDSDNSNPSRTAFRLKSAYASVVPELIYRAKDLSDVQLVSHSTVTEAARFEYSTNGGVTWSPLGTIPNVVGTLIRYTFAASPNVDIRPSLREA